MWCLLLATCVSLFATRSVDQEDCYPQLGVNSPTLFRLAPVFLSIYFPFNHPIPAIEQERILARQ